MLEFGVAAIIVQRCLVPRCNPLRVNGLASFLAVGSGRGTPRAWKKPRGGAAAEANLRRNSPERSGCTRLAVSDGLELVNLSGNSMIQASIRIVAAEGKRAELVEVLLRLKGPVEVVRGCRGCSVLQDLEDPNVLTYVVRWDTQEGLETHFRSERFRRLLPYIEMSAEPPIVDVSTVDHLGGIDFLVAILN